MRMRAQGSGALALLIALTGCFSPVVSVTRDATADHAVADAVDAQPDEGIDGAVADAQPPTDSGADGAPDVSSPDGPSDTAPVDAEAPDSGTPDVADVTAVADVTDVTDVATCDADFASSVEHCGACGRRCASTGGLPRCTAGACTTVPCAPGTADCNGHAADGCEANTATDVANCGACGARCAAGMQCTSGRCACPSGTLTCGGQCVNGRQNGNCGACGVTCGAGTACDAFASSCACGGSNQPCCNGSRCNAADDLCIDGVCVGCGFGSQPCCPGGACRFLNGVCANGACNYNGCGAVGQPCCAAGLCDLLRGVVCAGGACQCAPGRVRCRAGTYACQDLQSDADNCGACGAVCPRPSQSANANVACAAGRCGFTCTAGFADCDGNPANGCETNTRADRGHCGGCNAACPAGQQCGNGACGGCGARNAACCASEPRCPAFMRCNAGTNVCECGADGQPCCDGTRCDAGHACAAGRCARCGGRLEACCPGDLCRDGVACRSGRCF